MAKRRKGKLTMKEKKFIRALPTAKNATQAAIQAGYSPKTATVIASETLQKPHIQDALIASLEKHGLTEDKIAQTLAEGLEASTLFFFGGKLLGKLNQTAMEKLAKQGIEISGDDFLEIPDHYARHKYLETVLKVKGVFRDDFSPNVNFNFFNLYKIAEGQDGSKASTNNN